LKIYNSYEQTYFVKPKLNSKVKTIIVPISSAQLCIEINHLDSHAQLMTRGDFEVYFAQAHQIPNVLLEIGRLRELTFRSVGEGTGKALDIDEFDQYYYNLFIWDKKIII
jgi:hypothetical protein